MDFPFDINYILPYEITIFNGDYRLLNKGQISRILYVRIISSILFNLKGIE